MQQITPFLWFDNNAEEAAKFYVSIFKDSKINSIMPGPNGSVMGVTFNLAGQNFYSVNGGPQYKFTPAISLYINCDTQEEVDYFWDKLSDGGKKDRCGWLQDKFGLSWQVIPTVLGKYLGDPDRNKAGRVMDAMLKMEKLDIEGLKKAYDK